MRTILFLGLIVLALSSQCLCDVYMHNPRGSNNRLNEESTNTDNPQRLFDSQNNNKGGYCVGPPLYYYVGSKLLIEWTNQHACAQPKVHCNIVLQYMCNDNVRDGTTTTTIPDNAGSSTDPQFGMHESYDSYQMCKARSRQKGLFTADQNMNNRNSARHTRQDNNGQRHGYECNEERDYYPYWYPTEWKDIAVLTGNTTQCKYFLKESENVKGRYYCSNPAYLSQPTCTANGGTWKMSKSHNIDPPVCELAPWTRDNHNGNTIGGYASSFNWTIPDDPHKKCVLRLRYNISTGDYEGWPPGEYVDSRFNNDRSPVHQDERVIYFGKKYEMALNTDQYGRTFQDRSHVFEIRKRPKDIPNSALIWNLNVRGKRGNIVQVYPAVEYDFVPNRLHVNVGDYVHFQWTGCDTNPANNDGEGTQRTDRSNIAQILSQNHNKPWNFWKNSERLFDDNATQSEMAFLNQKGCTETNNQQDVTNCAKLNAASRYWDGGAHRMNRTGIYHYFCTRNNNFSNRSQKGVIMVGSGLAITALIIAAVVAVGALIIGAALIAGVVIYAKARTAAPKP